MSELDRVRWRCRRGLLELDLVLGRFVEEQYPALDAAGQDAFQRLLSLPDADLWALIAGSEDRLETGPAEAAILEGLRRC